MDAAKSSVKKFMSKSGHHDTTVHERVAPAVEHETVNRTEHERATTALDKEVHQDHYHTSEQPIHHSETLPEQHHHNLKDVEHRSFEHDNADEVQRRLKEEQSKYQHQQMHVEGERTMSNEPTVAGEHVHHHVHENIQPVVQKQTVEPHVVHTTVPVHEVHHNAAQHHSSSALPAMSMDDFKKQGGSLAGREERHDKFDGCPPEQIGGHHRGADAPGTTTSTSHGTSGMGSEGYGTSAGSVPSTRDSGYERPHGDGGFSDSNKHGQPQPASYGNDMHTGETTQKPSLMDKLNPKVDANGDGKAGFMK